MAQRFRLSQSLCLPENRSRGPGSTGAANGRRAPRQRSEQYRTSSQSRAHFLRQVNGRPHAAQIFVGNSDLRTGPPGRLRGASL